MYKSPSEKLCLLTSVCPSRFPVPQSRTCFALSTLLRGPLRPLKGEGDLEVISPKIFQLHVLEAGVSKEMFRRTPFPGVWEGESPVATRASLLSSVLRIMGPHKILFKNMSLRLKHTHMYKNNNNDTRKQRHDGPWSASSLSQYFSGNKFWSPARFKILMRGYNSSISLWIWWETSTENIFPPPKNQDTRPDKSKYTYGDNRTDYLKLRLSQKTHNIWSLQE